MSMTPTTTICLLIRCINEGNQGQFYQVAENFRNTLAFGGDGHRKIGQILHARPKHMTLLDTMQGKAKGLVEQRDLPDENVFINDATRAFLDPLLTEWANRDLYSYHNLGVRTKLLLHGPTGNGKTTIARYIARQADLPLVEVRSDSVIASTLGSTGQNINRIFDNIKEPCVLLWDEIDTVGRTRGGVGKGDSAELENERMVNSMLLNMERLDASVIFIGATNRREVLDSAFLRRFHAQFEAANPSEAEKESFASQLAAFHKLPDEFMPDGYQSLVNFSDVKLFVIERARGFIAAHINERQLA